MAPAEREGPGDPLGPRQVGGGRGAGVAGPGRGEPGSRPSSVPGPRGLAGQPAGAVPDPQLRSWRRGRRCGERRGGGSCWSADTCRLGWGSGSRRRGGGGASAAQGRGGRGGRGGDLRALRARVRAELSRAAPARVPPGEGPASPREGPAPRRPWGRAWAPLPRLLPALKCVPRVSSRGSAEPGPPRLGSAPPSRLSSRRRGRRVAARCGAWGTARDPAGGDGRPARPEPRRRDGGGPRSAGCPVARAVAVRRGVRGGVLLLGSRPGKRVGCVPAEGDPQPSCPAAARLLPSSETRVSGQRDCSQDSCAGGRGRGGAQEPEPRAEPLAAGGVPHSDTRRRPTSHGRPPAPLWPALWAVT